MQTYEWDVFISHASEDKNGFVRPLADKLQSRGLKVWYDEQTLTLGDSLRRRIDEGLAKSRYGVVVLSPAFFAKAWPQNELDGLVARESSGRKVVLPLWHRLDRDDVARYSPILAGRLAASSANGIDFVVNEIQRAIGGDPLTSSSIADVKSSSKQHHPSKPVEVFYSYSQKDENLRDDLELHLKLLERQGVIAGWHDRKIGAGQEWKGKIDNHLDSADVVLLIVSADFLASDYCYDVETRRALERHEAGEAKVIPVILRSCDWKPAPFGKLQSLPRNGNPITSWDNRDEAFTEVAKGIRGVIDELNRQSSGALSHGREHEASKRKLREALLEIRELHEAGVLIDKSMAEDYQRNIIERRLREIL